MHRSVGEALAVLSRRTDANLAQRVSGEEYEVGLSRRDGSDTTWVYIGAGPREYLELSLESARQLADVLARQLPEEGRSG
ncbi:hypothetical protein C7K25_13365 [Gulosibacter molinativorax]|uniref:Uncharacterized protein n=1 Tax=Gulosibacter molinativorax TaxID=256821 RepID=A0ABT7CB45_9MICO|nr:hypothetical protein [Gulosibacter molinativorax]